MIRDTELSQVAELAGRKRETELGFDPRDVSIATATFYPKFRTDGEVNLENVRGVLALESMRAARDKGYQISVIDGGSSEDFLAASQALGIDLEPEKQRGMSASRRQAFDSAEAKNGAKAVVWTEPEKVSFVEACVPLVVGPILSGQADIVIPRRNPALFETSYPPYQFNSETKANAGYNSLLKRAGLLSPDEYLDMFFGPKVYANREGVRELFHQVRSLKPDSKGKMPARKYTDPEKYSNAIFLPVAAALHQGLRVASVEVPFVYPPSQQAIEQTDDPAVTEQLLAKRRAQSLGIRNELLHGIRFMSEDPRVQAKTIFTR
jgi:hypothetical protein